MSGEFGAFRFGWDAPTRISGSTMVLQEATELLPGEVRHGMVPFLPTIVDGSGDSTSDTQLSADGHLIWQRTPAVCDLAFYQGDDIVIPLYFNDPAIANDDMSAYEWFAQVRVLHSYQSRLVNTFVTKATFNTGTTEDDENTMVELFLPREDNTHWGTYNWELYSIGPANYSRFPKPDDVLPADWPPTDSLRTWLYGCCAIVPRVATTDMLPAAIAASGSVGTTVITQGGWSVGPNGRVP